MSAWATTRRWFSITPTALSYSGAISGSGSLTQTGPGVLTLLASNTFTGGTTISAGTLQVERRDERKPNGNIAVGTAATLVLDRADSLSMGNTLTGPGGLVKMGGDTVHADRQR